MGKMISSEIKFVNIKPDPDTPEFPDRLDISKHMNKAWVDRMTVCLQANITDDWNLIDGFTITHDIEHPNDFHVIQMAGIAREAVGHIGEAFNEFIRTSNLCTDNHGRCAIDIWLSKVEYKLQCTKGMTFDQYVKQHILPPYAMTGPNDIKMIPRIGD